MGSAARTRAETINSTKSKPCALVVKTRRTRTGCLTCRDRHVKCDEGAPICERCRKVGRECVRGWNVKFVHGVRTARETVNDEWDGSADYLFDARQKWVPIRSVNLTFVDETNGTRSSYTRPNVSSPAESSFISPIQSPNARHPSSPSAVGPPGHQQGSSSPRSHVVTTHRDDLPPPGASFHGPYLSHNIIQSVVDHSLDLLGNAAGGEELSSTPPETVFHEQGKLSSEEETYLLHHFIRDRAPLLDICDPHQHFARLVPELALKSPLLFNAVLAVSAHHLSRTAGYDPMMAEMYHERCVEILIPLLNDMSLVSDEVVAATVLLRYYEQMSSAVTGFDCERHLTGTSAFMNSESTCATTGGLRQASFWIFVRQDLDVALSQQRPLRLNLEAYAVEMDLDIPSDDWGWANRIVWITAEVVAFSFGWDKPRMKYEELRIKTEAWMHRKPESLRPLCVGRGSAFPTVYYSQPCHAIGMQYYHITTILLALVDSQRLKIGFGHKESRRQLQQEIAHHAGLLFGTCTTVDDPGTRITACNALSVCAPWLTDRAQQESLIAMLRGLERDVAWPTRRIALGAMAEWNWTEEQRRRFL